MNQTIRNAINAAVKPHTGNGKTRTDYYAIRYILSSHGYYITNKVADQYSADMSSKHNVYEFVESDTWKPVNALLVIDEYFGNQTANGTHEINAYVA